MLPMTAIETLRRAFEAMPGVRLAVVFGSAATGMTRSDSDIDVGVSIEGRAEVASAVGVALERAAGRAIDLVSLDTAPPLLRFEIARDGLVLVERNRHGWADFRAHAMIDWWDWAPTARMMHRTMKGAARRGGRGRTAPRMVERCGHDTARLSGRLPRRSEGA